MNFKAPIPEQLNFTVQKLFIINFEEKKLLVLVDFFNPRCKSSAGLDVDAGRRGGSRSNGSTRDFGGSSAVFRGSWLFR